VIGCSARADRYAKIADVIAVHLETALARISDLDAARSELVLAWTAMPCERLSHLVELVDVKTGAVLPYQLANLGSLAATKAPVVLAQLAPDPRVAHELLDLFAMPPWRSNPALPVLAFAMSVLRVELAREHGAYPRAVARQAAAYGGGYPDAVMRHFAETLQGRTLVVDARTPFYPGMTIRPSVPKQWPLLGGIVDDITLLGR
jgi:hypothetical protein